MTAAEPRPSVTYLPGRWVALAADRAYLIAELEPGTPIVAACWEAVERGAGVDALLGAILREGLRSVPSFAIAERTDAGLRVLVSGKAQVEIAVPGQPDPVVVSAAEAPTWIEHRVEGNPDFRLVAEGAESTGGQLPLTGGIVLAASLSIITGAVVSRRVAASAPRTVAAAPDAPAPAPVEMPPTPVEAPPAPVEMPPAPVEAPSLVQAPPVPPIAAEAEVPSLPWLDTAAPDEPAADPGSARTTADFLAYQEPGEPGATPAAGNTPAASNDTMYPPPQDHPSGVIESLPWQVPEVFRQDQPPPGGAPVPGPPPAQYDAPPPSYEPPPYPGPPGGGMPFVQETIERSALPEQDPTAAPMVHAVGCPNRHLNPPYADTCRVCSARIQRQDAFTAPRPLLGVLVLSTGDTVPLDRDVVLGRAPFHADRTAQSRPHLVQLSSPGNDISRSHVRVSLEGWHVQVADLGSTNGTVVTLPGQAPVRLRAHDPFTIVAGTSINVADEVQIRFEIPS